MLVWIKQPPEFFGKILRVGTHALEVVEVFGGDLFEDFAHATHGHLWITIAPATTVELCTEEAHELAALCFARLRHCSLDVHADMLHGIIVHVPV